jgi:general L-amino acid transport system permease protein
MPMPSLLRDRRVWRLGLQIVFLVTVIALIAYLGGNLNRNLQQKGIQFGFEFLGSQASFDIAESLIPFKSSDSYAYALVVGLLNTLQVSVVGIVLATIVGIIGGIARLSDNWLVRQLALVYVEAFRNTPLLLQLFFWYFAIFFNLPPIENPTQFAGILSLSKAGISLPGGVNLSAEFSALLFGLAFSTAAFIAEIVRGGIQAVPKGQWEASKSLGFKPLPALRLVIFPQALRIIIPPLTGQYLNLVKNSSLAVAVGYRDIYSISATMENQTGRAVEAMVLIMVVYLTLSLAIALLTNWYNQRVQLVER